MRRRDISVISIVGLSLFVFSFNSRAQSDQTLKFEVGADFASISKSDSFTNKTEAGFGGRLTFNLNKNVALEGAGYFFPHRCFSCDRTNGNLTLGLFGVKAGKRFEKWGIFAKARPGFASSSQGEIIFAPSPPGVAIDFNRTTNFAFDLGAVLEFYPSKRIVTRFDAGDTMIRFKRQTISYPLFDPTTGNVTFVPFILPATTRHNFQFTAGVGFRF